MPEKNILDDSCFSDIADLAHKNGRRCILTKKSEPVTLLVRLVLGPDGTLVPDVAARLPGRGIWMLADGALIEKAVQDGSLHRQASRSLKVSLSKGAVPQDLVAMIDRLLVRRCLDRLGLEQKAGNLLAGFDKIKAALGKKGHKSPTLVLAASDGADDGRRKIQAAVGGDVSTVVLFDREALSKALGRDNVVHVLLLKSGGTQKLKADISRLLWLRGQAPLPEAQGNAE
ncbi:DUF448 domain-containing protein [Kordiimonas pumila]|uniref:DUF448 domain-containing protein n=1 Tax=Kordiimonas pumila TaxID=2161677 RepID=A0ABV7CZS6_9PROT|nr:DUF448 domain-containing protein [Kordiimonas pumila]